MIDTWKIDFFLTSYFSLERDENIFEIPLSTLRTRILSFPKLPLPRTLHIAWPVNHFEICKAHADAPKLGEIEYREAEVDGLNEHESWMVVQLSSVDRKKVPEIAALLGIEVVWVKAFCGCTVKQKRALLGQGLDDLDDLDDYIW